MRRCDGQSAAFPRRRGKQYRTRAFAAEVQALEARAMLSLATVGIAAQGTPAEFRDGDGTRVEIRVSGPGEARVDRDPATDRTELTLTGTGTQTRVTVRASGGDGRVVLGRVADGDPLGGFLASRATLEGSADFDGGVRQLVLGNVGSGGSPTSVHLGSASGPTTVQLGAVVDTQFVSEGPIQSLSAARWADDSGGPGLLWAPQFGRITIGGNVTNLGILAATHPAAEAGRANGRIGALRINGRLSADSAIVAGSRPGVVRVGGRSISPLVTPGFGDDVADAVRGRLQPPRPEAATGTDWGHSSLHWERATLASGTLVDVSTSPTFETFLDGYRGRDAGDATSLEITGLKPGTTYYYRLRSYYRPAEGPSASDASGSEAVFSGYGPTGSLTTTIPQTVTLPLTKVAYGDDVSFGVTVSVAGGPPRLYLFDTGSSGMFVADARLDPANYAKTPQKFHQHYTSGTHYKGDVIDTTVDFGQGVYATGVELGLIEEAYGGTISHWDKSLKEGLPPYEDHYYGTFGTSLTPGTAEKQGNLYNVIAQLPGNLNTGFIIHSGGRDGLAPTLTIGLTDENRRGFVTIPIPAAGAAGTTYGSGNGLANGVPAWDDRQVMIGYDVEGMDPFQAPTTFDTGDLSTTLYTGDVPRDLVHDGRLVDALKFAMKIAPGVEWKFDTGSDPSVNRVDVGGARDGSPVNTGIGLFYQFDVMYDIQNGLLGFRPVTAS